jgi:pimeloyl-ACP methyl ester carboxylesterase
VRTKAEEQRRKSASAAGSDRHVAPQTRRHFLSAVAAGVMGFGGKSLPAAPVGKGTEWELSSRGQVAVLDTEFGPVAYFVPRMPRFIVMLAHGYPWPDGWLFGPFLLAYAKGAVTRWMAFGESKAAIVLAPALGAGEFAGYREMFGRRIDADEYVNRLVDRSAGPLIPGFDGRFALHGHSAGGQFAARYLVTHPSRLRCAILSAPSTYPFPDPKVAWPNGMGAGIRGAQSGDRAGKLYSPNPSGWLRAASEVAVTVLVGSRDTGTRPASPAQPGSTRLDRAKAWVKAMTRLAESSEKAPTVRLVIEPGLDHDEAAIGVPAQRILAMEFASRLPRQAVDKPSGSGSSDRH